MAAGQRDIPVLLQPGGGATVRAPGEFLYLKFADREIQAIVTGRDGTQSRVKMVTGDFTAPGGGIDDVELINPDTSTPCAVVITVGDGEFDRKIIQGEVTITPGIRGADGQFVDDTRSTVRLRVAIGNIEPREYVAAEEIARSDPGQSGNGDIICPTVMDDMRVLACDGDGKNWKINRAWPNGDWEPIANLGLGPGSQIGAELWVPDAEDVPGLGKRVVINIYDAATFQFRRKLVTAATWGGSGANPAMGNICKLPGDRLALVHLDNIGTQNKRLSVLDMSGAVLFSHVKNSARYAVYRNQRIHLVDNALRASAAVVFDASTYQVLPSSEFQFPNNNYFAVGAALSKNGVIIGHGPLVEYAITDISLTASGSVTSCAGGGFLKSSPIDTQAEIYTQRLDDGRVLMSGEILRAALEIYTGRYMPANYLDYVYRVRAENLNGISPRTVDSGGKSFLAAGIPDDASGTFPQTLEITLREGLL